MPFSGGTYTAPSLPGSWNPAIEDQSATAADWNTLLTDLSTALSTCITRNGQSTITANLPMGGFKLTGLAAGSTAGDSVRYEQIIPNTGTTTFLAANVLLNNVANFFNGPNTGAIGASGQTWLLIAIASIQDTAGAASVEGAIHDGTSYVAGGSAYIAAVNGVVVITTVVVVTLSAATTYTLRAKDATSTSGILLTTSSATVANKATSITAIRLT